MTYNVLIAGPRSPFVPEQRRLEQYDIQFSWQKCESDAPAISRSEIDGIICNGFFLHHRLEDFPRLRFVQLVSAGWDKYPIRESNARGISAFNAAGVYSIPMAEWVVGKIFELLKRSRIDWEKQLERRWLKQRELPELFGKTAVIFGLGHVAAEVAPRLRALGMTVIGVSRRGPFADANFDEVVAPSDETYALRQADIVISCIDGGAETVGRFGSRQFGEMKTSANFINLSRGSVVDEAALEEALVSGAIGGAALDVFVIEPLPDDSALWAMPNVILTPHQSFESDANSERLRHLTQLNLKKIFAGGMDRAHD